MADRITRVTSLSKREFKEKIFNYTASKEWRYEGSQPAVIDFYADWCAPCKRIAPMMDNLSVDYEGRVKFYKVNTEKDPELAKAFGISSIPTLMFIPMEGKPTVLRGAQPMVLLRRNVDKILGEKKGFLKGLFSFSR